ncbi:shikimate kinase [Alphaproteobacteria bacterium]|nr:shikimate kinase [Alphaproteobacteria bacterium]GHS99063.1 shikimate kinase [Alphaproteobacteria bacterium]
MESPEFYKPLRKGPPTISFMPPKTIALVGLMGCGKTSIGRRLARKLELPFSDSDQEVETAAGCSMKEIYSVYGEDSFKSGERRVIARLLDQPPQVLATGGASILDEDTQKLLKDKSITVWLNADLETLIVRVSRRNDRPFLQDGNHREVLENLIRTCYPVYEKSDVHVKTYDEATNTTVDRVIQAISEFVKENYPDHCVLKSI